MTLDLNTIHLGAGNETGSALVRARGALDFDAVTLLREYLQRRVDAGDTALVVDLLGVQDPEPSWGAAVAAAAAEVTARGASVVVVADEALRATIHGTDPTVVVAESLDDAHPRASD